MRLRYRLGEQLSRLADWLRWPPRVTCQFCGYADDGVHESPNECAKCLADPSVSGEHHAFVAPPWWRRIGARR